MSKIIIQDTKICFSLVKKFGFKFAQTTYLSKTKHLIFFKPKLNLRKSSGYPHIRKFGIHATFLGKFSFVQIQSYQWMVSYHLQVATTYLFFVLPRVSSRSSDTHSSWILSPSHGLTLPIELLPNANSSVTTSAIGISALLSYPAGIAGEQVPLWPGVHMRDPPLLAPVSLNPNGFAATRLNVGDVGPLCGTLTPEYQS